jgi:tetraacyldisaccharide 4'-kinase
LRKKTLPGFVVSVGNITVGGTGKTPAVSMLAGWARQEGYRTAVLSRGYGGSYQSDVLEVSDGVRVKATAQEAGDEPYLLAKKLQGTPVIVSKKRFAAGMYARERFGCDLFILDDGFQHVTLKRDLDLVLIDGNDGFGNGHLLPLGPLREPIAQLARADAYVITRCRNSSAGDPLLAFLKERFPGKPVFHGEHIPERVLFPSGDGAQSPLFLGGKRVLAFAGLARPRVLRETLTRLGADVVHFREFRDHHPFTYEDLQDLILAKEGMDAEYLITTEKDWVRMGHLVSGRPDVGYLQVRFRLKGGEGGFFEMIRKGLVASIGTP